MNANEISPKVNARLNRIKIVSRIVKCVFLAFLGASFCFSLMSIVSLAKYNGWYVPLVVVGLANYLLLCLWYWKLAQLFGFYEQGLIFTSKTIRCIKYLGVLCVMGWALSTVCHVRHFYLPSLESWLQSAAPPGTRIGEGWEPIRMGFFSFAIEGVNLGLMLAGIVIVLIAWIMDEGRKIQEEQELTV